MKEIYSKYWMTAREDIYGFSQYDKNLCEHLLTKLPKGAKVLEIAIGTGYPIADCLQKAAYAVYGIDICADLIRKCRVTNPRIQCAIGDAEHLPFTDGYFGGAYCFHSTSYFPNLNQALDEMLRVTQPSGFVIFDIQNRNSKRIAEAYCARLAECSVRKRMIRSARNIAKLVLMRGTPVWHWVVHEVPTYPESVYEFLEKKTISKLQILGQRNGHSLELNSERGAFADFERLIVSVEKS